MSKTWKWFHHNGFKTNTGKFHFLLSTFVNLTFKEHVTNICSKANQNPSCINKVFEMHQLEKLPHSHEVVYHITV